MKHQGDPPSLNLFNAVLKSAFRDLEWEEYGVTINGRKMNNFGFADDVGLISENGDKLQTMVNEQIEF